MTGDRSGLKPADTQPPRANHELLGHGWAEARLLEAWRSRRMPHAWLITGPDGIGKATLAYRFARWVLSGTDDLTDGLFGLAVGDDAQTLAVAPSNPAAIKISVGSHPNLLAIERAFDEKRNRLRQDILVDQVRRIVPLLRQTAADDGWRIVIVDGAQSLNVEGQNALLKLLEEPPARALLMLTADSAGSLLPTIRSRCRRLDLSPLPEDCLDQLLERHLPDVPDDERAVLRQLAEGSIGRAVVLHAAGGPSLYARIREVLAMMPAPSSLVTHALADALIGHDVTYDVGRDLLIRWIERFVRSASESPTGPDILPGDGTLALRLAPVGRSVDRWLTVLDRLNRLFGRADAIHLDRKQVILTALEEITAAAQVP